MVISRHFEPPDVVTATLRGVVTASDHTELLAWIRASIRHAGAVRLLIRLEEFAGWNPGALLDSASWLADDEAVLQIAIVGQPEWKLGVFTMMAQPLRGLPIRYFETESAARAWLGTNASRSAEPTCVDCWRLHGVCDYAGWRGL